MHVYGTFIEASVSDLHFIYMVVLSRPMSHVSNRRKKAVFYIKAETEMILSFNHSKLHTCTIKPRSNGPATNGIPSITHANS